MIQKVRYESHRWKPSIESVAAARWDMKDVPRKYKSAVLAPIAMVDIKMPDKIESLYRDAIESVSRFDTELGQKSIVMPEILLRSESASSSQIENLSASARNIAIAELGGSPKKNTAVVAGNIRAMKKALEESGRMSKALITRIHKALMEGHDPQIAGKFRKQQVWIGGRGTSPHGADFVPPHHEKVGGYIADLVLFANRGDIHGLLKAAVAHCQFETIHPFLDGNGRTGRALIQIMLHESGLIRKSALPISAGLLADTKSYFAALGEYRDGNISKIVELMCRAAIEAVGVGYRAVERVETLRKEWDERIVARKDAAVWRLMDLLLTQPVVDAKYAAKALGVTDPAARNAIEQLCVAGILASISASKRDILFEANEVTTLMDSFAGDISRRH